MVSGRTLNRTVHFSSFELTLHFYNPKQLHESIQLNIFYNVESTAFSQNLRHTQDGEAFSLDVDVTDEGDNNHMLLSICMR